MNLPIRIISDLHFGQGSSLAKSFDQLAPLLEGIGTLVCNGDTVEGRGAKTALSAQCLLHEWKEFVRSHGVHLVLINGNHDPRACELDFLELAHGLVVVTHGDCLFEDVAPWSRHVEFLKRLVPATGTGPDSDPPSDAFAAFLSIHKEKSRQLADMYDEDPSVWRYPGLLLSHAWPPWRPLRILRSWRETPDLGVSLLHRFRPQARFLILGHTHFPGIWRRDPYCIVNTGSYHPVPGRNLVDVYSDRIEVRKVRWRRKYFQPSSAVRVLALGHDAHTPVIPALPAVSAASGPGRS